MMKPEHKLYREGEVPKELRGKGIWRKYGNELLFSPFNGTSELVNPTDWTCEYCKQPWYKNQVIKNEYHCPRCGRWAGLLEGDKK